MHHTLAFPFLLVGGLPAFKLNQTGSNMFGLVWFGLFDGHTEEIMDGNKGSIPNLSPNSRPGTVDNNNQEENLHRNYFQTN